LYNNTKCIIWGLSLISFISDFVAIIILPFPSCSLVLSLKLGLWHSLTDSWTTLEFFFSSSLSLFLLHVCCYDLSRSHGQQLNSLPLTFESICIIMAFMHSIPIKLPRPSQEQVTHYHGNNITLNSVSVIMYAEGNLHIYCTFTSPQSLNHWTW
jgi:hypothetical protein